MGSCSAYEVAKRGYSVLLLEQYDFLHRRGSSHGETRTIRITYPEPYYVSMMKEAFRLWYKAQEEAGYRVHTPMQHLDFGHPSNSSLQEVISACSMHSIHVETLTPDEASCRFPPFSFPDDHVVLVTQEGGVIHASKAVAMFQALALKHGAVLRDRTKVLNIDLLGMKGEGGDGSISIVTEQGSIIARKCIITAGAWTQKLLRHIHNVELPIQPLHTTIAYWKIEDEVAHEFSVKQGFPSFAYYSDTYMYGNASLELPGLVKVALHSGFTCDPDERALIPDRKTLKDVVSPWLDTFLKAKVKSDSPVLAEACMYSMTPDQDFILDFLPMSEGNIVIGAGFSGHGFKMGPLVGRILADLALNGSCGYVPLEYFSIARFDQNSKGNVKAYEEPVRHVAVEQVKPDAVIT
ncbi:hypothetical protein KP509_38G049400 [Ceratopteris richardii]|nr:hypothetical protein KP509_38G049400 [Ceratopteris richardii]